MGKNRLFFIEEKGMALIMTLILIALLGIITTALISGTRLSLNLTRNISENKQALYAAESGINYGWDFLEKGGDPLTILLNDRFDLTDKSYFTLEINTDTPEEGRITIISTGFFGSSNSKVKAVFNKSGYTFESVKEVMASGGNISVTGNASVSGGDILSNGDVSVDGSGDTADCMVGAAGSISGVSEEYIIDNFAGMEIPSIDWSRVEQICTENDTVVEITGHGSTRLIELGDDSEEIYYFPDSIGKNDEDEEKGKDDGEKGSNLSITGKGTLFVNGDFKISGQSDIGEVVIVTKGDVKISGSKKSTFNCGIFSEGNIDISANLDFTGNLISKGTITLSGSSSINFEGSYFQESMIEEYTLVDDSLSLVSWEEVD